MSKYKNSKDSVVYSTNPDFKLWQEAKEEAGSLSASQQTLYISLERLKGGKVATIVEQFKGSEAELEKLGKELKAKCGVGGTVKDGIILLQGEQRDKAIAYLQSRGFKTKRKGG